jgi:hypothetical protein
MGQHTDIGLGSMSEGSGKEKIIYWPRVKELLDGIMEKWIERWGREPLPGIHAYYWETPEELQESVLSGIRAIEPGVTGRDTQLVRSLARSVGTSGRMPLRGPFMPRDEIEEIIAWIDNGMPKGPDC